MNKTNKLLTPKLAFFLFCRFLSTICEQLLLFAIPLLVYHTTGDASKSGLAYMIEWLPAVLLLPFIGILTDLFHEKKMYIVGDVLRSLVCLLSFLLLLAIPSYAFIILAITSSFLAILNSQNFVALETTIAKNFHHDEIPRIQSLIQGMELASGVVAPALASVFVLIFSVSDFLLITSIAFLLTGFGVLGLPSKKDYRPVKRELTFRQIFVNIGEGFGNIVNNYFLRLLVLATMLTNLVYGTVLALNPAVAQGALGASSQQYSFLGFFGGITGTIVVLTIPFILKKFNINVIGITAIILLGSSGIILGLANQFFVYVIGYASLVSGIGVFNVFLRTERAKLIPKEHLGKSMGTIVFFNRLCLPLAGIIVAMGTKVIDSQQVILGVAGTWILLNVMLFSFYFSNKRKIGETGTIGNDVSAEA